MTSKNKKGPKRQPIVNEWDDNVDVGYEKDGDWEDYENDDWEEDDWEEDEYWEKNEYSD